MAANTPPQDTEAEICTLGSMLLDVDACGIAIEVLNESDFYLPAHKLLFREILELYDNNQPIDTVLLHETLRRKKLLEKVGGTDHISSIQAYVPVSSNVEHYATIVKDKATLRKLLESSNEIQRLVYGHVDRPGSDTSEILELSEQLIFEIAEKGTKNTARSAKELAPKVWEQLQKKPEKGIMTGYREVDMLTSGFKPGQLIIIAGRTSMGKTSFALNIMAYVAGNCQIPVVLYSMETDAEQITKNIMTFRSGVTSRKVGEGGPGCFNDTEYKSLLAASDQVYKMKFHVDDVSALSPLGLRARTRRMKANHGVKMVFIDYLQLMDMPGKRYENRQQEISYISRQLKRLARDISVPVVALCQLSRAPESRGDHLPRLSDLRESGAIEQDADMVFLLFREYYYNKDDEGLKDLAEVNLAKHRNGPTRQKIKLVFKTDCMKFEDPIPHFDA